MLFIDFSGIGIGEIRLQSVYIQFAMLHLSIALGYFYMWSGEGLNAFSNWLFLFPDWLNLIGSTLFLVSACMYPFQFDENGDITHWFDKVQLIELVAVVIELIAAYCWLIQWFIDYRRDKVISF